MDKTKQEDLQRFDYIPMIIQESKWQNVEPFCNGWTVTNIGDVIVKVNDQIYYPGVIGVSLGDSRSFGGNEGEIYKGIIKVAFQVPPGGVNPQIELVQKVYIFKEKEDGSKSR